MISRPVEINLPGRKILTKEEANKELLYEAEQETG